MQLHPSITRNQPDAPAASIHPAAEVGAVTLKVADLARSIAFYTQLIGLHLLSQTANQVTLGAGTRKILTLEAVPNAQPQPRGTTGLYHAAILLPDRHALAVKIAQIAAARYPISGYADHLVSEAFYLNDPDGNGLELYRDRPRDQWPHVGGQVQMASDPIDLDEFFASVTPDDKTAAAAVPTGTKLGHIHLRVGNIAAAEQFYHGVLGFDSVVQMPSALFVSAGGYHHHIGLNIWESRNGKTPGESSVGLREFTVILPDVAELDRLTARIETAGVAIVREGASAVVNDPWQNRIVLTLTA